MTVTEFDQNEFRIAGVGKEYPGIFGEAILPEDNTIAVAKPDDDEIRRKYTAIVGRCVNDPAAEHIVWIQYGDGKIVDWPVEQCSVAYRENAIRTNTGKFLNFIIEDRNVSIGEHQFNISILMETIERETIKSLKQKSRMSELAKQAICLAPGDAVIATRFIEPADLVGKIFPAENRESYFGKKGVVYRVSEHIIHVQYENETLVTWPFYCLDVEDKELAEQIKIAFESDSSSIVRIGNRFVDIDSIIAESKQ